MARISDARKAERLNHAWRLLQHGDDLGDLVERMARDCAISERQAYRYLEQARSLKRRLPSATKRSPLRSSCHVVWCSKFANMHGPGACL